MAIDWLGGYEIEWKGTWTITERNKILNAFVTVKSRQLVLIQQITRQIDKIKFSSSPGVNALLTNLINLRAGFQETINNINSTTYNLEIYEDSLGDTMATYWPSPVPWFDDKLTLGYDWVLSNTTDYRTIFHELTHTWSDDGASGNNYTDAHLLETLFVTDFIDYPFYKVDYKNIFGGYPE